MENLVNLYAIRDDYSGFTDPLSFSTDVQAREAFRNVCLVLSENGRDVKSFSVYRIGTYDILSGLLNPLVPPVFICSYPELQLKGSDENA